MSDLSNGENVVGDDAENAVAHALLARSPSNTKISNQVYNLHTASWNWIAMKRVFLGKRRGCRLEPGSVDSHVAVYTGSHGRLPPW